METLALSPMSVFPENVSLGSALVRARCSVVAVAQAKAVSLMMNSVMAIVAL
jgi:hypothetical protein